MTVTFRPNKHAYYEKYAKPVAILSDTSKHVKSVVFCLINEYTESLIYVEFTRARFPSKLAEIASLYFVDRCIQSCKVNLVE